MASSRSLFSDVIISFRFVVALVAVIISSHHWRLWPVNSHRFNLNGCQADTSFTITTTQSKTSMIVGWTLLSESPPGMQLPRGQMVCLWPEFVDIEWSIACGCSFVLCWINSMWTVLKFVWVSICLCLVWCHFLEFVVCVWSHDVCVKCRFVLWRYHVLTTSCLLCAFVVGAAMEYIVNEHSILCSCLLILFLFVCVRSEKRGNFRLSFSDWFLIICPLCLSPGICSIFSPNDWYNVFVQFQSSKSIYLERLSYERDIRFCHLGLDCQWSSQNTLNLWNENPFL